MTRRDALLKSLLVIANRMGELKKTSMDDTELDNLTMAGLHYIETIGEQQTMTMAELAHTMGVSKPSTTSMVSKLMEAGLLNKKRSAEDRRVFIVQLSPKGKCVLQQHRAAFEAFADQAVAKLGDDELDALLQLLAKIS